MPEDLLKIHAIITDPKLFHLSYGQNVGVNEFKVEDNGFRYLLIIDNKKTLGCFQIRPQTKILLEAHIYLLPKYWGEGVSEEALDCLFRWSKGQGYFKVFTDVPEESVHVHMLLNRVGCDQIGKIKDGVVYNNRLQDLYLYSKDVRNNG